MRGSRERSLIEEVKELFVLHWGERRGFILLTLLLSIVAVFIGYRQWMYRPPPIDMAPYVAEMEDWLANRAAAGQADTVVLTPFTFDPNTVGVPEWLAMGLTQRQAEGIERYKEKGGQFRVKRDMARMYSLLPGQYEALEPFIDLPDSLQSPIREKRRSRWTGRPAYEPKVMRPGSGSVIREDHRSEKLEVNTADSTALVALRGIGPSFARGILKYRELLGGYVSLRQLQEVHVLKDKPDALARVQELLVVDTLAIRRIPINTCTAEELAAHPYVRWRLARPLIAYRDQHGPFSNVESIKGCVLVDDSVFAKLAPYLTVDR